MQCRVRSGRPTRPLGAGRVTDGTSARQVPLARPVLGERRGAARARRAALRAGCRSGRCWREFERAFARVSGRRYAQRGLERHGRPAPGAARGRRQRRRRGRSRARSRSSPAPTSIVYERARPVFADIDPVTLNLDPTAAAAAVTERTTRAAAGAHLRLPGRHAGVRAARAADRRGRVRGARRGRRRRRRGRRPRPSGGVRLLREQAADDRRGRDGHDRRRRRSRSGSTPSATRAARPTWTGSTTTGSASTTGCPISPARSGSRSSSGSTSCSPAARASRRSYREALGGRSRASSCRAPTPAASAPRLVRVRGPAARAASIATRSSARSRERGIPSKPYLPAVHLMSYYRERFGHREGEFPVCEDVAARSIALPFFPRDDRGQVARVASSVRASAAALTGRSRRYVRR